MVIFMREKYESLGLADLKAIAKARGLRGTSTMKKAELVDLMLAEDEKDKAEGKTVQPKGVMEKSGKTERKQERSAGRGERSGQKAELPENKAENPQPKEKMDGRNDRLDGKVEEQSPEEEK